MVIKRSPGGEFAGGGQSTWTSTCEVPGWLHLAIDQHPVCPNLAPAWTLTSDFDRISWPLTSEMFTFWICTRVLQWSCLKAVSVSTFVLGGLRGFTATSDLVIGASWPKTETPPPPNKRGARAHHVMVSKVQWKPFWLATQLYPQNDWTGWQNGVKYEIRAHTLFGWVNKVQWFWSGGRIGAAWFEPEHIRGCFMAISF